MVKINSNSRFFSIKNQIILTQTDTTVGFLSQNKQKLNEIKERPPAKPFIKVYKKFSTLINDKKRIPNSQKKRVRCSNKTTFIIKDCALRVSSDTLHSSYLRVLKWNYSTSANQKSKNFKREFCEEKTDIIIENKDSLYQGISSFLYKINSKKIKRLR